MYSSVYLLMYLVQRDPYLVCLLNWKERKRIYFKEIKPHKIANWTIQWVFQWVNAHLIYRLCKLGLFWFLKIIPKSSPQKQLIQIIPNGEIRKNLSFNLIGFICFHFLCKIFKSENENQASDCMIIEYFEPLVFNIHSYLLWVYV